MSLDTTSAPDATLSSAAFAAALRPTPPVRVPGPGRRVVGIVGESLALVGIVFGIPFVILAIGIPIVLFVRLLLWLGGVR
jgi:hypothetical protein